MVWMLGEDVCLLHILALVVTAVVVTVHCTNSEPQLGRGACACPFVLFQHPQCPTLPTLVGVAAVNGAGRAAVPAALCCRLCCL